MKTRSDTGVSTRAAAPPTTMVQGCIFDIKRYAIHDGPGIRVTVFLQGCPLRCVWCHNPEGQNADATCSARTGPPGEPADAPAPARTARVVSVDEVIREIEKDVLFFEESGGGPTFSGGEPLMQPDFLRALLHTCRERDLRTAVDTCGYAPPEVVDSIVNDVDLFLFDLKLMDDDAHREATGVSNRTILETLRRLAAEAKSVMIRLPVIPGITDTDDNATGIATHVASLHTISDVALLPFHKTADGKYRRLRRKNVMENVEPPERERLDAIRSIFENHGLRATVGG